jgi:hypothetical protein
VFIHHVRRTIPIFLMLCITPVLAGTGLTFDVETLNRILPALSASQVEVAITAQRSLVVELHEMEVVALEPGVDGAGGRIATRLRVKVPALGLDVRLEPKLLLEIVERQGLGELHLRFDEVPLKVPLAGKIDLAPMLPPMRFPAVNLWTVEGAEGNVAVRSRVTHIEMDSREVHFEIELDTVGGGKD